MSGTHGALGAGEKVQVSSDGGVSWADVTSSTATTWSYTDPATHGTSFTYLARIVDGVGNVGASTASQAVTIDTAAPTAPSITSIPENGGGGINAAEASDGTPVVVGLAGTGAAAGDTLTVNWGGQTVSYTLLAADISASSATVTVPLATLVAQGQGTFDVTARLTDAAGNAGPNSAAVSVTVDTTADAAPGVAVTVSDPLVSNAEKTAVEFTVSGLDPDAGADVTFTGVAGTTVVVHVTGNAPATANLSGLDNGPVAVSVVATDTAGNTATGTGTSLTLDATADVDGNLALSILSDTSINASERRRPVVFTTSGIDAGCNEYNGTFHRLGRQHYRGCGIRRICRVGFVRQRSGHVDCHCHRCGWQHRVRPGRPHNP